MTTKNLAALTVVAAVLGGAAYCLSSNSRPAGAKLNGKAVYPGLDLSKVAKIALGDRLVLASGTNGWTVETYHGYPADREKITQNLMKLTELKVGQVARGKTIEKPLSLTLRDADGKDVAEPLALGERHAKWGHGRYATFAGETVLVSDGLEAFDAEAAKQWVETKIVDEPWISFNDVVEGVGEDELGFATGVVARVTVAGDTNRFATVGAVVKGGTDRYFKLNDAKWVYKVSSYAVEKLLPKPEKKDEPKTDGKAKKAPARPAGSTVESEPIEVRLPPKPAAEAPKAAAAETPKPAAAEAPKPAKAEAKPDAKAEAEPAAKAEAK